MKILAFRIFVCFVGVPAPAPPPIPTQRCVKQAENPIFAMKYESSQRALCDLIYRQL